MDDHPVNFVKTCKYLGHIINDQQYYNDDIHRYKNMYIIGHSLSPTSSVKSQDHETLIPACSSSFVE